jgi:hypothetical protein
MDQYDCDEYKTLFEIQAKPSRNGHNFCKMLSQQKHFVLHFTVLLQLKRFEEGCWVTAVTSSPLHPVMEKHRSQIAQFIDVTCIYIYKFYLITRFKVHIS